VPQEFNFNQFEPVEEILINRPAITASTARSTRACRKISAPLELWDKRRVMAT